MFSQEEIDAVLSQAQKAVDSLASEVSADGRPAATGSVRPAQSSPQARAESNIARIMRLNVPVVVRLAERRMLLNDILRMAQGTILEFDRTVDSELDLMVNNQRIGSGVAVKVNEHFGLRINKIGNTAERIASLGGA